MKKVKPKRKRFYISCRHCHKFFETTEADYLANKDLCPKCDD